MSDADRPATFADALEWVAGYLDLMESSGDEVQRDLRMVAARLRRGPLQLLDQILWRKK